MAVLLGDSYVCSVFASLISHQTEFVQLIGQSQNAKTASTTKKNDGRKQAFLLTSSPGFTNGERRKIAREKFHSCSYLTSKILAHCLT